MTRYFVPLLCVLGLVATTGGCTEQTPDPFTESVELIDGEVDTLTLNRGREGYILYCYACHGMEGDGNGPAAWGLRPPPRDFRTGTFKFAGVAEGLPHDEDLVRIVKDGLLGTPMLEWDIPQGQLSDILQYVKTFSCGEDMDEGWCDPDNELGERIVGCTADQEDCPAGASVDPWGAAKKDEAVIRGKKLYHAYDCSTCHAGYATRAEVTSYVQEIKKTKASFRPDFYEPEIKPADGYMVPIREAGRYTLLSCEEDEDCDDDNLTCHYGACARRVKILPPDFLFNDVRSGTTLEALFRTIGSGIPGTAMPAWKGSLPDEDLWAMAHYVRSLVELKGTPQARELKKRLKSQ